MSKDDSGSNMQVGEGGSLARFTIVGNFLYVVSETSLTTYAIPGNSSAPVMTSRKELGFGAETIFPYGNNLLLGTQDGMYIFDISSPESPSMITLFQHIRSCDPVVAENDFAYITLNSSNQRCSRGLNEMQIVDIHNLSEPFLLKSYTMSNPQGLDVHNDTLFVCDNGLKIIDVSDKQNPVQLQYLPGVQADDVIYTQGRLLVIGKDGLSQYAVKPDGLSVLSILPVVN